MFFWNFKNDIKDNAIIVWIVKKCNEDEFVLKDVKSYYNKKEIKVCSDLVIYNTEKLEIN